MSSLPPPLLSAQIVELASQGLSPQEIEKKLNLSAGTVREHYHQSLMLGYASIKPKVEENGEPYFRLRSKSKHYKKHNTYYQKNRERILKERKENYKENKEKWVARSAEWQKKHKDYRNAYLKEWRRKKKEEEKLLKVEN